MKQHMIRYTLKPERVAENERLSRAVFDALKRQRPTGLHYATFRLGDGSSFMHVVSYDDGTPLDTLTSLPEFKAATSACRAACRRRTTPRA